MTINRAFALIALCVAVAVLTLAVLRLNQQTPSGSQSPPLPIGPSAPPTTWPDYSAAGTGFLEPSTPDGALIAQGYGLLTRTFALIGPQVEDPARRFAGNNLTCQNCHLDGGTNRFALPLVGVFGTYPKFSTRAQRVISLTDRLNECMTRSMNGRPLPEGSPEMAALLAYLRYVGDVPALPIAPAAAAPPLAPDAGRGALVFMTVCAACHQSNGLGQRVGSVNDNGGYGFPPLWGPDSYNDGAGMDHDQRIVGFVQHNMPRGVDPLHPQLSLQQAWDVSTYVIAQPRPHYEPAR